MWYIEMINANNKKIRKYFDTYEEAHAYSQWVCAIPRFESKK